MDKPEKGTYDPYCPMCEYLQAEGQRKAAEIEGTGARKTFMARQSTLDEVRRLVELSRDKEFDEWGRGHDSAIDEVLVIIDAMKEESNG